MSRGLWRSLAVFALALAFWAFFQSAKQLNVLAAVSPFGDDPYDAIGSFGIQAAGALAVLSIVRALGFLSPGDHERLLARTQLAAVLPAGITVAADAVALVRHPAVWWAKPGGMALIALVVAFGSLTATIGAVCYRSVKLRSSDPRSALAVCAVAALVLYLYPEGSRDSLIGALAAIAAGMVLLFVPLRFLTTALIGGDVTPRRRGFPFEWIPVIVVALVIGALFARAEAGAEGALRPGVALIFIGFELAAVAFGYAMMRGPLALILTVGRTAPAAEDRRP